MGLQVKHIPKYSIDKSMNFARKKNVEFWYKQQFWKHKIRTYEFSLIVDSYRTQFLLLLQTLLYF